MRRAEIVVLLLAATCGAGISFGSEGAAKPVTPNAAPEAVELLKLIYSISGKHTMTGQHNFPNTKDKYTQRAAQSWGKVPAVYGQDMGFAKAGDQDSYLARPDIVAECKRQYSLGSIVTICWHAVPPTADEPVRAFRTWLRSTPGTRRFPVPMQGPGRSDRWAWRFPRGTGVPPWGECVQRPAP